MCDRRAPLAAGLWPFVGQPILAAGGLQPAFLFLDEFLRLRSTMVRDTKPEKMPANGLFSVNGGLKGRLQARLPAPPCG